MLVANKAICQPAWTDAGRVAVSATTRRRDSTTLRRRIVEALDVESRRAIARRSRTSGTSRSSSGRATLLLARGQRRCSEAVSLSEEFVLADLQEARAALEEITGRARGDVLAHIFERFCIGK